MMRITPVDHQFRSWYRVRGPDGRLYYEELSIIDVELLRRERYRCSLICTGENHAPSTNYWPHGRHYLGPA